MCFRVFSAGFTAGSTGSFFEQFRPGINQVYLQIFYQSQKTIDIHFDRLPCARVPDGVGNIASRNRTVWIFALAVPFMTNLIIRVYAIRVFVGIDGPLQTALQSMGFDFDPFIFSQNSVLVMYGMVTTYLPFLVFPLYAALEKFDSL